MDEAPGLITAVLTSATEPPARQLLAYIRLLRDQVGAATVCPIGATAGEWDRLEPSMHLAVRVPHRSHTDWLTGVALRLTDATRATGGSTGPVAPEQWALHVNAVCQGALMSARMVNLRYLMPAKLHP
ncbi:MAG: hypothetical protein R3E42_11985 [Burkholderiaceae bacterium]